MITSKARLRRKVNAVKDFFGIQRVEDAPLGFGKLPALVNEKHIGEVKGPFCFNCDIFTKVDTHGQCAYCGKTIQYVERVKFFPVEAANG